MSNYLNYIGEGVLVIDPENRITFVNTVAEEMTGWTAAEIQGRDIYEALNPVKRNGEPYSRDHSAVALCLTDGKVRRVDHILFSSKDGARFPVSFMASPILENESVTGIVISFWDISEYVNTQNKLKNAIQEQFRNEQKLVEAFSDLKKVNAELKETQFQLIQVEKLQSVGRLAAGVAHEVKNPLAILQQGLDFLGSSLEGPDESLRSTLEDMVEAVSRADNVIRGLLDFAAPAEPIRARTNLNRLLDDSLLLVQHLLKKSKVKVVKDYDTKLPTMSVDKNRLQQVFVNLVSNSVYAMPKGGELMLTTRQGKIENKKGSVIIEIKDTGTGIPADQLAKVFDPFFTTRRGIGGTGLGLPVVKSIVDLHHGDIKLENRPEGGAKATVLIRY